MKNVLLKVGLVVFVFALLVIVPLNINQIFGYGTVSTPTCDNEKPGQPVLYEPNHSLLPKATGAGEVRLNWLKAARANKYTIGFGTSPSNYIYGANDIADTNNFTVRFLTPGTRYYFAVKGVNECKPGDWSREWSAVVGGRGGTTAFVATRSTGRDVVPTMALRKQGAGGNVVPTVVAPSVVEDLPLVGEPTPTPTPVPNFMQRFFNWMFGR